MLPNCPYLWYVAEKHTNIKTLEEKEHFYEESKTLVNSIVY